MARVIIKKGLVKEINKKFKKESVEIFELIYSLEENPHKGKVLASVGGIVVKELKYKSFRFYFLVEGKRIKFIGEGALRDMLIVFVRMSDKRSQQKVINEIKNVLRKIGSEEF